MTKQTPEQWLEANIKRIWQPNWSREDYLQCLTRAYYSETGNHWESELAAECHIEYALDGWTEMTATEFRILKRCFESVKNSRELIARAIAA